jgi:hypothetical protein
MSQTAYPHTEAAYWLIRADDAFSVEVITPWDHPITVSPLPLQATLRRGSPSTDGGHSSKARRAIQLTAAPRRFANLDVSRVNLRSPARLASVGDRSL